MADGSPLGHIKARIAKAREATTTDLLVPGLEEEQVHVRYGRMVGFDQFRGYPEARRREAKSKAVMVDANLDFLVDSCLGVYAVVDGVKYGISADASTDPAEWPKFDSALREMLPEGVPENAVEIARALFAAGFAPEERGAAEAGIIKHGDKLARFCGWIPGDQPGE